MAREDPRPEIVISGVEVGLRRSDPADLGNITRWERDPANARFITPWPENEHERVMGDASFLHLMAETGTGEAVGFVLLAGIGGGDGSVEFKRIVIGQKGAGYGRNVVRLVKQLAFERLGAHRLWLDVKDFNTRVRRLYESEGFVEEGTLRECVKADEGFESLVVMSMLESEYRGFQPG